MKRRGTVVLTTNFCSNHIFKLRCRKKTVLWDCYTYPVNSQAPCSCLGFLLECMYEWVDDKVSATLMISLKHKPSWKGPLNVHFQTYISIALFLLQTYMHLSKLPLLLRMSFTSRGTGKNSAMCIWLRAALWILLVWTSWNRVALDSLIFSQCLLPYIWIYILITTLHCSDLPLVSEVGILKFSQCDFLLASLVCAHIQWTWIRFNNSIVSVSSDVTVIKSCFLLLLRLILLSYCSCLFVNNMVLCVVASLVLPLHQVNVLSVSSGCTVSIYGYFSDLFKRGAT